MTVTVRTVARSLIRRYHWLLWTMLVVTVAYVLIGPMTDKLTGGVTQSIWEHAGTPARWVLFAVGVAITPLGLPPYLAHGVTRRTFAAAAGAASGSLAAATALYLAAGFLVERVVFATGRPAGFATGHLFSTAYQVHLSVLEFAVVGVAYLLTGWLVGSCYYRFGGLRGTLALPLAAIPAVAVENLLGTGGWTGIGPPTPGWHAADLPVAAALAAAVLVLGLAAAAGYALTRTMPIRTRRQP